MAYQPMVRLTEANRLISSHRMNFDVSIDARIPPRVTFPSAFPGYRPKRAVRVRRWGESRKSLPRALAHDLARVLVLAEADEGRMAEMPVGRPLVEPDLRDDLGLEPADVFHLLFRDRTLARVALGEIRERACGLLQRLEPTVQLGAEPWRKAVAHLVEEDEPAALVNADKQRFERIADLVAADDALLPGLELQFPPRVAAL